MSYSLFSFKSSPKKKNDNIGGSDSFNEENISCANRKTNTISTKKGVVVFLNPALLEINLIAMLLYARSICLSQMM